MGSGEKNLGEARGPRGPSERERASHWAGVRVRLVGKNAADWLPLLILGIAAAVFGRQLPPWLYMWLLAFALFVGCKWLCFRRALARGIHAPLNRQLGFLFGWIGMDAREFFETPTPTEKPLTREFPFAVLKISRYRPRRRLPFRRKHITKLISQSARQWQSQRWIES